MRIEKTIINESLESRRLLSFASLSSHGTLSVVGGSKDDAITVQFSGSKVQAILNGQTASFNKNDVKRFWMSGFGGDDVLKNATPLPATLIGGDGKDRLVVGQGPHELDPGIFGGVGDRNVEGDVIDYSQVTPGTFQFDESGLAMDRPGGVQDFLFVDFSQPLAFDFTPGNDEVVVTTVEAPWSYHLGSGNDTLGLIDSVCTEIDGQAGNDEIDYDYSCFADSIIGGSGNDTVNDRSGHETAANVDLGSGNDTWNIEADVPFNGSNVYSQTVPPGVEKLTLLVGAPAKITGNSRDNDIEVSSSGGATVSGESGNDRIAVTNSFNDSTQSVGTVSLNGNAGNDTLIGAGGPVTFSGGSGNDTADFSARSDNLSISLDNHANDGAAGENDNVMADIETVLGGSGNDRIVGDPFANKLVGNGGNDTIFGGDGNDTLIGGAGTDQLDGQGGTDVIQQ